MVTSSVIGAVILQCYSTNTAMETAVGMHIQGVMDTSLYACRIIIIKLYTFSLYLFISNTLRRFDHVDKSDTINLRPMLRLNKLNDKSMHVFWYYYHYY